MAEKLEFDDKPQVPISGAERKLEFDAPASSSEPPASDTEKRLTADTLRALIQARNGPRNLSDLVTGTDTGRGSYTERMTDHLIPGIKNVIGGAASAAGGLFGGEGSFGERWRAGVNAEKAFREQNREKTAGPLGYAADVAGIVGSGGRAGGPVTAAGASAPATVTATEKVASGLPKAVGYGATQGAISGAAEQAQDPKSAAAGAATGGVVGGAAGGILHGLLSRFASKGAAAEREGQRGPSPEAYRDQASTMFKQLDNSGIAFDRSQAMRLAGSLPGTLKNAAYDAGRSPEFSEIIKDIGNVGVQGAQPLTFGRLQALRDRIGTFANSNDPNMRRIAGHLSGMVDNFIEKQVPVVNPGGADLAKLYPEARKLWRTSLLGDTMNAVEGVADRTTASLPGTTRTAEDRTRSAITNKLNQSDRQQGSYDPFSPVQRQAAETVSRGTKTQNALDFANQATKDWKVNAALGAGAGSVLGGVTGLPIGITGPVAGTAGALGGKALGTVAKSAADNIARDNMDTLVRSIMTGSAAKPTSWQMPRDLLATLMAKRAAEGAGVQGTIDATLNKENMP